MGKCEYGRLKGNPCGLLRPNTINVTMPDNQRIIYNDLEPSEKVKVYNRGLDVSETFDSKEDLMVNYRTGDMWAPQIDQTEGLSVVVRHFRDCIFEDKQPIANGQAGLRIVQIMEAADKSLEMQGSPVEIRW